MAWNYSEKTKQLFYDAVHGSADSHLGEVENPDGLGEHGSISCGDALRFTFKVKKHPTDPTQDLITEAKYLTFGCTSAIASSEALCAIIEEGKFTPIKALDVKNEDIVDYLEGLPDQKIHCSVMGAEALQAAVFNWAQRRGVDLKALGVDILDEETEEGRLVCKCFGLTEPYLQRKIKELNLRSIAEVTAATKAGGACMTCHHAPGGIQDLLDDIWGEDAAPALPFDPTRVKIPAFDGVYEAARAGQAEASDYENAKENTDLPVQQGEARPLDKPAGGASGGLSPYRFAKEVEKVFDGYVRPILQGDNGDAELVDIKGKIIYVHLAGACSTCVGSTQTLKLLVERSLQEQVDPGIRVISV